MSLKKIKKPKVRMNQEDRRQKRLEARRQRAETYFWIYYNIPDRSLERLRDFCASIGLKRHINTFKNYSVAFKWQERLAEVDAKLREERQAKQIAQIGEMNVRQAQDFRNAQVLARAGMSLIAKGFKKSGNLNLSPQDIITWLEKGAKGERLAMGEATERFEAMLYVYNAMILAIANIFTEINVIKDMRERDRQFRFKVDELRHTKLIDYAKQE